MTDSTADAFARHGIAITVREPNGDMRHVLKRWQSIVLEQQGVYTLEGPNQAGKTALIKLLMGVIAPRVVPSKRNDMTYIGDKAVHISHVADAHSHGIAAVFQDDEFVPSMSIQEQFLMRHGSPRWRHLVRWVAQLVASNTAVDLARTAAPTGWFSRLLRAIHGSEEDAHVDLRVLSDAKALLLEYDTSGSYAGVLSNYPRELSSGAKAVARIVQAQLTRPVPRVLFLDEALSGVQADVWPRMIGVVKDWAVRNDTCLVVVTHNQRELIQWQPRKRFVIDAQEIRERDVRGYISLQPGLPPRRDAFPIFEAPFTNAAIGAQGTHAMFVVDKALLNHDALRALAGC